MTRAELHNNVDSRQKQNSKLQYSDFQKIILDFQLQEHERFLIKFTNLFKSVDNDQDGVISEVQFKDLLRMMGILQSEEEIESLLAQVDPDNNQKMTYSEVVLVLSSHMVPKDPMNPQSNAKVALLEKFIQDSESLNQDDILRMQNAPALGQQPDVGLSELGFGQSQDGNMIGNQSQFTENQPSEVAQQPYGDGANPGDSNMV